MRQNDNLSGRNGQMAPHDDEDVVMSTAGKDEAPIAATHPLPGKAQWTDYLQKTDHVRFFLETDWSSTRLGALDTWNPVLRFATSMLFADSRAACIYWGSERTVFYNEPFILLAGKAHPGLMGRPGSIGWSDIWSTIEPLFQVVENNAQAMNIDNIQLFSERNGFVEEAFFTGQFIPLFDGGKVAGIYNTSFEVSQTVIHARRRAVISAMSDVPMVSSEEMLQGIMAAFRLNPADLPMLLFYKVEDPQSSIDETTVVLYDSIGVPPGHPCAVPQANLMSSTAGLIPLLRKTMSSDRKRTEVSLSDPLLQQASGCLLEGVEWQGFGEPSPYIVISRIERSERTLGALILGTNPRRMYDNEHRQFIDDCVRQVEARWGAYISTQLAKNRERSLEDRAAKLEERLRHIAQHAPVGMALVTQAGAIEWNNEQFFDLTGYTGEVRNMENLISECFTEAGAEKAAGSLAELWQGADKTAYEMELKRKFSGMTDSGQLVECNAYVLAMGAPLIENDATKLLMGYITDISQQKWQEKVQSMSAAAAVEAKKQQEEFIDTTSHEMRNPLTAMTQLADGIKSSLDDAREERGELQLEDYQALCESNIEAADTILVCAAHQKRIVDDVLMLSRLESDMLSITPSVQNIHALIESAVRMFKAQAAANEIALKIVHDQPSHAVNQVQCDPSRLTQVLVNLIGNAIKFIALRTRKVVRVRYGATSGPPTVDTAFGDLRWMDRRAPTPFSLHPHNEDHETRRKSMASGVPLYLYVIVEDTGPGITQESVGKLFKRFAQASSRTHVTYGGSGLGLYICRELAEKQGGQVGIASVYGQGAAFGFYIETKIQGVEPIKPVASREASTSLFSLQRLPSPHEAELVDPFGMSLGTAQRRPSATVNNVHVLLVEDNLVNQRILQRQLTRKGCIVSVANNGAEALEYLQTTDAWHTQVDSSSASILPNSLDCILLDWEMPVMNGLECCRQIRQYESQGLVTRHLHTIAVTANARDEQIERLYEAGVDDVITKPFTVGELLAKMEEVLGEG